MGLGRPLGPERRGWAGGSPAPGPAAWRGGTWGMAGTRWGAATTRAVRRLSLMNGRAEGRLSKISGTWPATASLSAGPEPRYGTWTTSVWVASLNISIIRWWMLPLPGEA